MPPKQILPVLGERSFSCPHCGAIAHQEWHEVFARSYGKDGGPHNPSMDDIRNVSEDTSIPRETRNEVIEYLRRRMEGRPFLESTQRGASLKIENCFLGSCYSCNQLSLWLCENMLYPVYNFIVDPNDDMPVDIAIDFREAAEVLTVSPRGAAALLRLCIQKLCSVLGCPGDNINSDISYLVKNGLDERIRRALDIVRVIGNEAVHPGQIDLRDDRDTATQLFLLVNEIVEDLISKPKRLADLYESLPESKRLAIEQRDAKALSAKDSITTPNK